MLVYFINFIKIHIYNQQSFINISLNVFKNGALHKLLHPKAPKKKMYGLTSPHKRALLSKKKRKLKKKNHLLKLSSVLAIR